MRSLIALSAICFAAFGLSVAAPAHSEILYARPDRDAMSGADRWGNEVFPDPIPEWDTSAPVLNWILSP